MSCSTCRKRFFCITACTEVNEKLSRIEDELDVTESIPRRESVVDQILSQVKLRRPAS